MSHTRLYVGACLIGVLGGVGPGLASAQARPAPAPAAVGAPLPGPSSIRTTKDGWIVYPSVLDKISVSAKSRSAATSRTVQGTRVKNVCSYTASGTTSTAAADLNVEETAYNPTTCEFKVTVTPLTKTESTALAAARASSGQFSVQPSDRAATPHAAGQRGPATPAPNLAAASYTGHVQGQWWDPVGIQIAHQTVNMGWNYYASPYTWWSNTYGFAAWLPTPTGVWIYDQTYYAGGSSSKSGATFRANATMRNDSFLYWVLFTFGPGGWAACGFPTSPRANFYFNESIQAAGSNFNWTTGDSKSGACTNLVHHDANIGGGYA